MSAQEPPHASPVDPERHLPLVKSIAVQLRDHLPRSLELDDLIAWGTEGLMQAARRYDPSRGTAFSTYAYYRIRGAMFDGLRKSGNLSRHEWARVRALEHADDYLAHAAARADASPAEARAGATTRDTLEQIATHVAALTTIQVISIEAFDSGTLPDPQAEEAFEQIETSSLRETLRAGMQRLEPRERRLLELCYFEDRSLEESGRLLGISKSWASRIHSRAIYKLQHFFARRDAALSPPTVRPT